MYPLYMNAKTAAEYSGVSEREIKEMLRSNDPPPHRKSGVKFEIERDGFRDYLHERQEVVFRGRK